MRKRWLGVALFSAAYLTIHFVIFDQEFKYTGFKDFVLEGRQHIFHVAPVVILFLYFLIKEAVERNKKK